ncbi:MAG: flagellar hook-basal body complex protein FliE [Gammaproteobacteria bacterium]|nr:flagellar hook-basal body complex protein FliE [Gammaproteobacteria bacterium]
MSVTSIDQVLAQMRVLRAEAAGNPELAAPASDQVSFSNMLKQSIDSVNDAQVKAAEMKTSFELGQGDLNLAEVMIAAQKSSVSFEAMVQVRNKLIDAYKEVMNMPI